MGSFRGNCEIVELDRKQKPPLVRKGASKFIEDDINQLFEAINVRTSKSLDLSDGVRRDASKRPMRGNGSHSPVTGFSDPVSLKQAFRGLCISQAAEMAATKRLSKPPGSPRVFEAGRITCSSRFANTNESISGALEKGNHNPYERFVKSANHSPRSSPRFGIKPSIGMRQNGKIVPAESTSSSVPQYIPDQIPVSSPRYVSKLSLKSTESTSRHTEKPLPAENVPSSRKKDSPQPQIVPSSPRVVDKPVIKHPDPILAQNERTVLAESSSGSSEAFPPYPKGTKTEEKSQKAVPSASSCESSNIVLVSGLKRSPDNPKRNVVTSFKVANKTALKLRRKRGNKDTKLMKTTTRPIKNKNLVKKKLKEVAQAPGTFNPCYEINGPTESPSQLICHRCQCTLEDSEEEINKQPEAPVLKFNKTSKSREHGEFSYSSKSSIGDYSTSTTVSEESNLSCSGNRPHMSKDGRWGAINQVRKQYGFLGLSHFNLLKKLGCGDIGTVYLAELIGTSCLFAIKVMDNEYLARRKKLPRAQTEREILRMLDHPFLPTLYAQFTSDNLSCLVMEFCSGGDLHVLRQKQPCRYFPEAAARFYVAEVLLALEYLHMLGVVYRDLKPENILVREDGHIMLTDFDLSLRCSVNPTLLQSSSVGIEAPRISGPCTGSNCIDPFCAGPSCQVSCFTPRIFTNTARARKLKAEGASPRSLPQLVVEPTEARSNSFVGTHEYLAPEIIKGDGHGSAVDWWTLGVFLYELLYGKTPFKGCGNEETLTNVVMQNLRFPDSPIVSFQARDLIRGLLVKDPENRLGMETGAAEIKRHPFFDGLNWALIRCAVPPQVPGVAKLALLEKNEKFLEYSSTGDHLEFELF